MKRIEDMTQEELDAASAQAAALIEHYAAQGEAGVRKSYPLNLHLAMYAGTVQVVDEGFLFDDTFYYLARRPPNDEHFGARKLHLVGGSARPGWLATPIDNMREMAHEEMGIANIECVSPPIVTYQWTRHVDNPTGSPRSEVRLYRVLDKRVMHPDVAKYPLDELPSPLEIINGRPGVIHLKFIELCLSALRSGTYSCTDFKRPWD